jgi:hypothetical protein
MVPGGAGDLTRLLTKLSWGKYVKDIAEFDSPLDIDKLDERNRKATFWHWIAKVWIHEHPLPLQAQSSLEAKREALKKFDATSLEPMFWEYVRTRGTDFGKVGLNLEEGWVMTELSRSQPCVLVVERRCAANLGPHVSRMELHTEQILWLLADLCFRMEFRRPMFPVLVSDGLHGHVIGMGGLSGICYKHPRGTIVGPDWFIFEDPWPARSLLAFEQNYGGAKAIEDVCRPPAWAISPEDLNRVIVGFVLTYDEVDKLADMFRSMSTVSSGAVRPLWNTFDLMSRLHDGATKPITRAGRQGLQDYSALREEFNLPSADT